VRTSVAASPLSDAELTRAAQAGDAGSLGVLLARHEAAMRAVVLGMIGYGPDTDDVVQDAALVAVRRINDVRNPAAVGPWLRAVVRHECRMRLPLSRRLAHAAPTCSSRSAPECSTTTSPPTSAAGTPASPTS
jgi:DNA-directed RNA polymerase specialized sigma24 family protein